MLLTTMESLDWTCGRLVGGAGGSGSAAWVTALSRLFLTWACVHLQVKAGTIFDNFLITDSEEYAKEFGNETWGKTKDPEKKMKQDVSTFTFLELSCYPSLFCV